MSKPAKARLVALGALVVMFSGHASAAPDALWRGFLWPVKSERTFELSLGQFDSLEACRKTAVIRVLASGWKDGADWECGLNCVPASFPKGSYTCEDRTQ